MARLKERREKDPNYRATEEERIQEILIGGSYLRLIADKRIFLSVLLYGLLSLTQGGQDALYPVWLINPKENKGFDWTQSDVGLLYSWLGPVQMIAGHILGCVLQFLDRTCAERCGGASAGVSPHVAVHRNSLHGDHDDFPHLCTDHL